MRFTTALLLTGATAAAASTPTDTYICAQTYVPSPRTHPFPAPPHHTTHLTTPQHRRRLHPAVRQAGQRVRRQRLHLPVRELPQQADVLQQLHGQRGAGAGAEPGDAVLPGRGAVSFAFQYSCVLVLV
jgi:hypothetical protein